MRSWGHSGDGAMSAQHADSRDVRVPDLRCCCIGECGCCRSVDRAHSAPHVPLPARVEACTYVKCAHVAWAAWTEGASAQCR
jgi:hypothetical protein